VIGMLVTVHMFLDLIQTFKGAKSPLHTHTRAHYIFLEHCSGFQVMTGNVANTRRQWAKESHGNGNDNIS